MIACLRVCVRLPQLVVYQSAGQEKQLPKGTAVDWWYVTRIHCYSAETLSPAEEFESSQDSPLQNFIWIGRTTYLRPSEGIDVAVLWDGEHQLVLPVSELCTEAGTDWDRHVGILAWQQSKSSHSWEICRPLVIDDLGDPNQV